MKSNDAGNRNSLDAILDSLDRKELVGIIKKHAEMDEKIEAKLIAKYSVCELTNGEYKKIISSVLNRSMRRGGFIPYNASFSACSGAESVLEKAEKYLEEGNAAQGVKANVIFFERKAAREEPWTQKLWIYDLRINIHFTLKTNQLKESDLDEFVECYNIENRLKRKESERFKCFTYKELLQRDKVSLDISWLKDDSLEDSENLPPPSELASDIIDNLKNALEQFEEIEDELEK